MKALIITVFIAFIAIIQNPNEVTLCFKGQDKAFFVASFFIAGLAIVLIFIEIMRHLHNKDKNK
jgi:hypothetical protein